MAHRNLDAPIFVVGAPRSGTSILTWCLGQHQDVLATEESNWMGEFAVSAAVAHAVGSARGERSQLSACGLSRQDFLEAIGRAVNRLLLSQRKGLLANSERAAVANPGLSNGAIQLVRNSSDPKRRWVDGTPEYSLQIPAVRALFPHARFIHIVRDVRAVVKSLLLMRTDSGQQLVSTEQEAISYWYRCMQACLAAEQAWGSGVVLRVRYSDLVARPAATITRVLDFLSLPHESWPDACLEPLSVRLNSSSVPADFDPHDAATDPVVRAEAERLFTQVENRPQEPLVPDAANAGAQWKSFAQRVSFVQSLDAEYARAQETISQLSQELEERTRWALELDQKCAEKDAWIAELQKWPRRLERISRWKPWAK